MTHICQKYSVLSLPCHNSCKITKHFITPHLMIKFQNGRKEKTIFSVWSWRKAITFIKVFKVRVGKLSKMTSKKK